MGVLRILLALSVVASHGSAILGSTLYPGDVAVQIFFMISGFYMTLVLGERYGLGARGLMLFYSNRALRLYPAFLAVTLAWWAQFFLTWWVLGHIPGNAWVEAYETMPWNVKLPVIASNWLLLGTDILSNCYYSATDGVRFLFLSSPPAEIEGGMAWMHSYRTLGAAWSIGTEIWFYLLVPFLVRFRWFWLVGIFLLSLAYRFWIEHSLGRDPYFLFPAQLLFFIAGIWACQLYRHWKLDTAGADHKGWSRSLLVLNWMMVCLYPWYGEYLPRVILYLIVALSLPLMFAGSKNNRRDRFIGDLSYPLYLLHAPLQGMLMRHAGMKNGALIALICVGCAVVVLLFVERPFERLRRARVARSVQALAS